MTGDLELFVREFAGDGGCLTVEDGSPLVVEPWQREFLEDYFKRTREITGIVPKKNGKSTIVAGLALFELVTGADLEIAIAAASRDQAGLIHGQVAGFVRRSEWLRDRARVTTREIRSTRHAGRIRVLAADVDTADGWLGDLAIVDEMHRARSVELHAILRAGVGPRNGQVLTISTAGSDTESPLGRIRTRALELADVRREGAHRRCASADRSFVLHEWSLTPDDDPADLGLVKAANPASWQTPEALRELRDSPSTTPATWARFTCGLWLATESAWITPEEWAACEGDVEIDPSMPSYIGIDIGFKRDSSALAIAQLAGDGRVHVRTMLWTPTPGRPSSVADVRVAVEQLSGELLIAEVAYDPHHFRESAEALEERGITMVQYDQMPTRMAGASGTLYGLIREKRLVHDGDDEVRSQILAAVPSETERGARISKSKSRKRVDAAIALAIATDRAVHGEPEGPREPAFQVLV